MVADTVAWYTKLHAFFDEDLKTLTDLGIPGASALRLISEYVIIMFDTFHKFQQEMMSYCKNMVHADFLARVIWVSLKIHEAMAKFLGTGSAKYDPALSAAFIRFLTTETAANSSAALAKRVKKLEDAKAPNVATMKANISSAQGTADSVAADVVELAKRVKKLEN